MSCTSVHRKLKYNQEFIFNGRIVAGKSTWEQNKRGRERWRKRERERWEEGGRDGYTVQRERTSIKENAIHSSAIVNC